MILLNLISLVFDIFIFLIFVEVIGSWVLMARIRLPGVIYDLLQVVQRITSVILNPIRRLVPAIGGLDFSPIIALVLLQLLRSVIVGALR